MKKTDSEKKLNVKFYMTRSDFQVLVKTGPKYTRSIINLKSKPIIADNLISLYSLKPLVVSWSLRTNSYIIRIKKMEKLKGTITLGFFYRREISLHKDTERLPTY